MCFEEVIVEIKARHSIDGLDYAQTLHYLKAANVNRGLLINFGGAKLEWKRFIRECGERA